MAADPEDGGEFYHFRGRYCAERVHDYLARKLERERLTGREKTIAELLDMGWRYGRIARYLELEVQTVKNHASRIYDKLGVSNRYELSALRAGSSSAAVRAAAHVSIRSSNGR